MRLVAGMMSLGLLLGACGTDGVEQDVPKKAADTRTPEVELSEAEQQIEPKSTVEDSRTYPNGIKIQWFEKGSGAPLVDGNVYELNFKVKLTNGTVVDGNYKLNRDMLPFLVGYQMQTKGMDVALKELREGDFVEIYVPGNLARGAKGIPGLIPPNAPNIILVRVGKEIKPTKTVDGVKVWRLEESKKWEHATIGDNSRVAMHYFVGTVSNPRYDNSYQRGQPFTVGMKDASLVPGLRKGLSGMKLFDKLWILVPADQAYGDKGIVDLVKPNETIFYDVIVMDVDGKNEAK